MDAALIVCLIIGFFIGWFTGEYVVTPWVLGFFEDD